MYPIIYVRKTKLIAVVFILIFSASLKSQSRLGEWQEHLPFSRAIAVETGNNKIFCATKSGLFQYDKESFLIDKWSKVNGLNDIEIDCMEYSPDHDILILAYSNSNLDLIRGNKVINVPDIKRKQITGSKRINSIMIHDDHAYLSCGFGIISLNLVKGEISSTCYNGDEGGHLEVFETIIFNHDSIFAATAKGVRKAFVRHPNLENYLFWETVPAQPTPFEAYTHITYNENLLYAVHKSIRSDLDSIWIYNGHRWSVFPYYFKDINQFEFQQDLIVSSSLFQINIIRPDGERMLHLKTYGFDVIRSQDILYDDNSEIWIADWQHGLVHTSDYENYEKIRPNGPWDRATFDLTIAGEQLWLAGGGYDGSWNNTWNNAGVSAKIDGIWESFNSTTTEEMGSIRDIIRVITDPTNDQHIYAASWGSGVIEFINGQFHELHNETNTDGALQSIVPNSPYIRIGGMAFDSKNNLWVTNSSVPSPVSVRQTDGTWKSFNYGSKLGDAFSGEIVVSSADTKWVQLPKGNGLFVFNNGQDLDDISDDISTKISVKVRDSEGDFKVLNDIYSMAFDLEGRLWLGTSNGVAVYYSPEGFRNYSPSNSLSFFATQPSVDLGDNIYHPLLGTEIVSCIAIDGANRKWFGTRGSGVFLTNSEGTELVKSFNILNSPLLSDNIMSIAIDNKSGEVYFGTEAGIVSYRGDAIKDDAFDEEIYAFPNPVRPDYSGPITIRGIAASSLIKITDIGGNLVYETKSLGGQAIWNGRDLSGNKVHSGVYMVFASTADAGARSVAKILIVR